VKGNQDGRDARIFREVKAAPQGVVALRMSFGGARIVEMIVAASICPESVEN
jgi:hypothetical protein